MKTYTNRRKQILTVFLDENASLLHDARKTFRPHVGMVLERHENGPDAMPPAVSFGVRN